MRQLLTEDTTLLVTIAPTLELVRDTILPIDLLRQSIEDHARTLNQIWLVVSMALVFLMQAGFLLLEAGASRSKNAINVAQKNLIDFALAGLMFYLIGFSLMFGPSWVGIIGTWAGFPHPTHETALNTFLFQLMFCGTAATIVSGAIAERMTFKGYLALTVLISAIIYPIFGHWAWGNVFDENNMAFLASQGFIDFAGGSVVHSVGGWVALAAIIVVGPRADKFDAQGRPRQIIGHSAVMSALGCLLLWIGWIGFNGGSVAASSEILGRVVANTMMAGIAGGVIASFVGFAIDGVFRPDRLINGVLAGLVAITAGASLFTTSTSIMIGMIAGVTVILAIWALEHKFKLDDVVGAVAVHGVCGSLGTIFVGVFGNADQFGDLSRPSQILVQVQGVVYCAIWSFGISYVGLRLIDRWLGLRVSLEVEEQGLNAAEHGWSIGSGRLLKDLSKWREPTHAAMSNRRFDDNEDDEAADIGHEINRIMAVRDRREQLLLYDALHDPLTGLMNRHGFGGMAAKAARELDQNGSRYAIIALDLDGFKPINDQHGHSIGDDVLCQVAKRMATCLRVGDTIARIGGDEFVVLAELGAQPAKFADELGQRILDEVGKPFSLADAAVHLGVSGGITIIPDEESEIEKALELADQRLYEAKRTGRNQIVSGLLGRDVMSPVSD